MKLTILNTLIGSFGKGKAEGAWSWQLQKGIFGNYKSDGASSWPL